MEPRDLSKRKGWTDWSAEHNDGPWSYGKEGLSGWSIEWYYGGQYRVRRPMVSPGSTNAGVFPTLQAAVMYVEIEVSNGN